MNKKRVMKLASRGKRLGAYCIDAVIPFAVMIILMAATGTFALRQRQFRYDPFGGYGYGYGNEFGYGYGNGNGNAIPQLSGRMAALMTFTMLVFLIYLIVQLVFFSKSRTMGKAALGLQVISSKNGKPIGFWMMLLREWIVKRASSRIFLLGYIWVMIDEKNRGWHDKILDTYVIDEKESKILNRPKEPVQDKQEPERTDFSGIVTKEPELPAVKETALPVVVESNKVEDYVEVENSDASENAAEVIKDAIDSVKKTAEEAVQDPAETSAEEDNEKDL